MRRVLTLIFLVLSTGLVSQEIEVLSAKDSLRVSFASLLITNERINYSKTADADGVILLSNVITDSAIYNLTIHCFGFEKISGKYSGKEIRTLGKIFLKTSDIRLDEVVITAQYEPTIAEKSVQRIKVIDQEKIRQMGAVNLRDVLSNQLNIRLEQDNILGSQIKMQGLSGENVKILVDGVAVIGRLDGNIDLSQINMDNVERIEVIEGPLSVQYGTNAIAGTINIITKKGRNKKYSAGITGYYESIGTYNLNGDLSWSHKKNGVQLSGGRNYFDGWNNRDAPFYMPQARPADSSRFRQWKPKEQYFATLAYRRQLKKGELGLKSAYFDEVITNRGYPRAPYAENAFDDYYYTKRIDNSLSFQTKIASNWSVNALSAYNYYNRIKKTLYKDLTTLDETLSANSLDQDTTSYTLLMTRASFIHNKPGSKLNYELGYDLNYESGSGKKIEKQVQYMGDYAVFATTEYRPAGKFVLKPGLRYASNTAYKTPLVPSLNIKYTVSDQHTLRASYARGFRAPNIKELYFYFVDINHNIIGNSEVRSEQSDNYSFSYNYNRDIKKCRVKFDAGFFYNNVFNMINLAQVGNTTEYTYINVGRFRTFGMQLGNSLNFKRLTLQTGFNYSARYNRASEEHQVPEFSYSPEAQANLNYRFIKQKLSIALFYKYTGALPGYRSESDGTVLHTIAADYEIMDLTAGWSVFNNRMGITFGCKNILDVKYINSVAVSGGAHGSSSSSMPVSTGRNYFIKLALSLSK